MKTNVGRVAIVALAGGVAALLGAGAGYPQASGPVVLVPVTGVIELGLAPFVERALREAAETGAVAVVLDIDTPGGRVDAAERIGDALADSEVPVYAYVNRRALSAGALISLASDGVFMRPGSVIGAATPVVGTGERASEKIVSAMRSEMRALAEARGLDPAVAEAMVDEQVAIPGVIDEGRLLTLTTEEAEELGYARAVDDLAGLLGAIGAGGAQVNTHEINWAERLVRFLSHPALAPFLLSLGFLGLIVEIKSPGVGIAGLAGVVSLALYFGSHLIVGLAGWEDMLLVLAGVGLMTIEAFVLPGFGIFGFLGIAAVLGGLFMSLMGGVPTMADLTQAGTVLSLTLVIVLVAAWALMRHLPRSGRAARSGLFLHDATERELGYESARRRTDLVGLDGVAITDLRPSGVGLFGEERVDVVAESEWISQGDPIRIISAEGYRHVVRPGPRSEEPAGGATEALPGTTIEE